MKESFGINLINDVKIVLGSVSKGDNYQTMLENRLINWDLSFTVYANVLPPRTSEMSVVQDVVADVIEANLARPGINIERNISSEGLHEKIHGIETSETELP